MVTDEIEEQLGRSPEDWFHRGIGKPFLPVIVTGLAHKTNRFDAGAKLHRTRPTVQRAAVWANPSRGRVVEVLLRIAHRLGSCRLCAAITSATSKGTRRHWLSVR